MHLQSGFAYRYTSDFYSRVPRSTTERILAALSPAYWPMMLKFWILLRKTKKKGNLTHFQFDRWLSNEVTIRNHSAIVSWDNCGRNLLKVYFRNLQSIILDTHQFREPHLATHREHSPSQLQQHCKRRTSWPGKQPYQCVPYFQNSKQFYGAGVQEIPFMPTIKVHDLAVIDFVETSTCSAALCTPI